MPIRLALAGLAALALPALTLPAAAQSAAQDYVYRRGLGRATCPPGLKLAAGACVRRCPAGYQDMGRRCRLRDQSY